MEQSAEVRARLKAVGDLLDIVGAMRALAAVQSQQAGAALPGIRRYAEVIEHAIGGVLATSEPRPLEQRGARCLLVVAAEHGFAGSFDGQVIAALQRERGADDVIAIVGTRAKADLADHQLPTAWSLPMASTLRGVGETAGRLQAELERRFGLGEFARLDVLGMHLDEAGQVRPALTPLVPLDLSRFQQTRRLPPLTQLPRQALLESLAGEYVFAELTRVLVESLAAESTSRLRAMESARQRVDQRVDALTREANTARQEETTAELLDLVTGILAVQGRVP